MSRTGQTPTAVVQVSDSCGVDDELPDPGEIAKWAAAAMNGSRGYVCVRIVDAGEIKSLNEKFRGIDKPTNVLSFPGPGHGDASPDLAVDIDDGFLGDIAICASVIAAEALAQNKPADAHWAHMIVHGVLHLLGLDHEAPGPRQEMEQREVEILAALGYEDPYQVRTTV